ncbi:MAG: ABC transporter permease [Acidimicrobiia bacterium]
MGEDYCFGSSSANKSATCRRMSSRTRRTNSMDCPRGSVLDAVVGYLLLLFFSYSFSWVRACLGLMVPTPEVVNNATFIVLFPLTFIANTFVPSDNLPGVLRTIAEWNPVSTLTHAVRVRFGNIPEGTPEPTSWPLQNATLYSLGFAVLLIVIFAPIATRLYRRTNKR